MKVLNWFTLRRKAIVPLVIGILGIVILYLQLSADGNISNADWQTLIGATVAWLLTTAGVHQATNSATIE